MAPESTVTKPQSNQVVEKDFSYLHHLTDKKDAPDLFHINSMISTVLLLWWHLVINCRQCRSKYCHLALDLECFWL